MKTRLRYAEVLDYAQMAAIDRESYDLPWGIEEFDRILRAKRMIGQVAEIHPACWRGPVQVVAYLIYRRSAPYCDIIRMAMVPRFRRCDLGRTLLEHIPACTEIRASVPDTMLDAHLFLKELGFRAIQVVPDPARPGEAAYRFRCKISARIWEPA